MLLRTYNETLEHLAGHAGEPSIAYAAEVRNLYWWMESQKRNVRISSPQSFALVQLLDFLHVFSMISKTGRLINNERVKRGSNFP